MNGPIPSKIGVHVVIGARNGFGAFLQRIANAGKPLALVKCVDDFGAAGEAKQIFGNKVLTVGRINESPNGQYDLQAIEPVNPDGSRREPEQAARWYYSLVADKWKLNKQRIDVWETFNEYSANWDWQSEFYLALMDLVEVDGFKLALYACSTGNPHNVASVMQLLPALKAAKLRGHYLSLHEYGGVGNDAITLKGSEPYHALRYRQLYESILIPNEADPPLVITECGQNGGAVFPGQQVFMDDVQWYDDELRRDPYVVGAALFTLGSWAGANYQKVLPVLADYLASDLPTPRPREPLSEPYVYGKPPIMDRPPVTPPMPHGLRGAPRVQYPRVYLLLPNEPATPDGNLRASKWLQAVLNSGIVSRYRLTLGFSPDDAGIGDLDSRHVLAINPTTWPNSLDNFFTTNYPGVTFRAIQVSSPEELLRVLASVGNL